MSVIFPVLRVGNPTRFQSLTVFPLFSNTNSETAYRLSDDALADASVVVEEVSEGGSVPDLLVNNKADLRVLFLEGQELIGAKQNRILNTSVLVAAHTKMKIPVSCVEQGRWRYQSKQFGSSGSHSPSKLRRALKASVSESVKAQRGHRSDQGAVWQEVAELNAKHCVPSPTSAMSDAFETHRDQLASFREQLPYIEGASGIAVAIGSRVVSLDLFDKPATCEQVWHRILSGLVFDALEAESSEQTASVADVEKVLTAAGEFPWEPSETVGEGAEYRAASTQGDHASALIFEGTLVHGSVLAGV